MYLCVCYPSGLRHLGIAAWEPHWRVGFRLLWELLPLVAASRLYIDYFNKVKNS
jgi:hypothetical protein